ncbi:MAG: tRNA uridine(34) 5-carboxymethylaminomethyl modification radical SAM/GNAT enzyme Elp3 [Coriobacteriia bacterium]|nr:tRNA uridine(34) 5-carboxymethylaminomethyl modification radical SAM/GNAT enzyme Elp3 [Coriobacteriia bacterium]
MELLLLDIVRTLREHPDLDSRGLGHIINMHSNRLPGDTRFAKKQLMPYYLHVRENEPERWESWNIDGETEKRLLKLIQMKPRRTASGVATITVITKPWTCTGSCLFCPADVRMPKSYLHAEPACQRAERNWFDPYLQVSARLHVLQQMGHATDKVEIIVLGGTFDDYPHGYRIWFMEEVFRALNDAGAEASSHDAAPGGIAPDRERASWQDSVAQRSARYRIAGIANEDGELAKQVADIQAQVTAGTMPFNEAIGSLYQRVGSWKKAALWQQATLEQLECEQRRNETASCRCVGLVVETRPELATPENLTLLRRLGCTKVQVGVQTLDDAVIARTGRTSGPADAARTFGLLRLFGFKIHAHFMVNLPGATPEGDKDDYRRFATDAAFQPDEVKLYPCVLIESAPLARRQGDGVWRPYDEDTLVDVLVADVLATPSFTRISRMIRDFSAGDIVAGNKKTNLRQMVEARLKDANAPVREIRFREIGTSDIDAGTLTLEDVPYATTTSDEHFLQWVTADGHIAGFLRLSLPHPEAIDTWGDALPIGRGEAMIREVHVYGRVARLGINGEQANSAAQHIGLGRQLIARAADIARDAGCTKLNVISAIGTRKYYESLGFRPAGLYQQLPL